MGTVIKRISRGHNAIELCKTTDRFMVRVLYEGECINVIYIKRQAKTILEALSIYESYMHKLETGGRICFV